MGIVNDLQKIARTGANIAAAKESLLKTSIAKRANDSIFQFPCIVSNTIPIDMASTITKLLDRNYASFVQIVLSHIANVDLSVNRTPNQFLKSVHQNMRLESGNDEDIYEQDLYDGENIFAVNEESGIAFVMEAHKGGHIKNLRQLNIHECREYLSDYDIRPFMEADMNLEPGDITVSGLLANTARNNAERRYSEEIKTDANKADIFKNAKAAQLTYNDVKKLNDLTPYAIEVKLNVIDEENRFVEYWNLVVGVKAILHLVDSNEIIENISRAIQNRGFFLKLIKWTTGEISLFKDIILGLDDIKFDNLSRDKGYSRFFPTLRRLKEKTVAFRNFKPDKIVPNASLIISSYELFEIQKRFNLNLKDLKIARKLMSQLFLMTLVIIDDSTQTVDILYDGDNTIGTGFQTYALETIEREMNLSSNRLGKEIGRMISR